MSARRLINRNRRVPCASLCLMAPGVLVGVVSFLASCVGSHSAPRAEHVVQLAVVDVFNVIASPTRTAMLECSGLAKVGDDWFMVSDSESVATIFRLEPSSANSMIAAPIWTQVAGPTRRADLEGIAPMAGGFLLVDEATSSVIRVDSAGGVCTQPIDLRELRHQTNAGLEGVSAGCDRNGTLRVFVAKEREPRFLLELDPESLVPVGDLFDVPCFGLPRQDRFMDGRPCTVPADFADLCIADGYLYALVRNAWEVVKIDMVTRALVARAIFPRVDHDCFLSTAPFGLVEGLWVSGDAVWLVVDDNGAERRSSLGERGALLVKCTRPLGF